MKKAYKKKLPKYWLGTRMPTSLGYQPNQGIGGAKFSSERGESLEPELKAAKANIIPNALNKFSQSILPNINTFYSTSKNGGLSTTVPLTTAAAANAATNAAGSIVAPASTGNLAGGLSTTFGTGTTKYATSVLDNSANIGTSAAAETGKIAGESVSKSGLNAAGKALAAVGALYGIGQGVSDWIHQGEHRSASDMKNALTTNTYTTDYGNSYKELAGFNADVERDYEKTQRINKNINNTVNGVGTALSTAAALGAASGVGIPAALAIGGLYGLTSWALGFGDNSDEIEQQIKETQDYMAMYNRQQKSAADSADIRQGFYNRDKAGTGQANKGKKPVFGRGGKENARVSNGELIGNLEEGWEERVPGKPNNKDTKYANLASSDYVIKNSLVPYVMATGDRVGALIMQDIENRNKKEFKEAPMKAKNGKLPKFAIGTLGEYLTTAAPHLGALFNNWEEYNRIRNSDRTAPRAEILDYGANDAISRIRSNKLSSRPYINAINEELGRQRWGIQRMPGIGLGGRMVAMDSANRGAFDAIRNTMMDIDKQNIALDNTANEMQYKNAVVNRQLANDNFWRNWAAKQQINQAYESYLQQNAKNRYTIGAGLVSDLTGINRAKEAQALKNKMLGIYQTQADLDTNRWIAEEADRRSARQTQASLNPAMMAWNLAKLYGGL